MKRPGTDQGDPPAVRRPIRTRDSRWPRRLAARLAGLGVRPNTVSIASVLIAALAGTCLLLGAAQEQGGTGLLFLLVAACFIQLRLVCNLLDGLMAVEGGLKTRSGEIFNDLPDRFSDSIVLVCAGYAAAGNLGPILGWSAAVAALLTAYVRVLGYSAGVPSLFIGPMAKQHRMAVLTVACVGAGIESLAGRSFHVFEAALVVIVLGCAVTFLRRLRIILRELDSA